MRDTIQRLTLTTVAATVGLGAAACASSRIAPEAPPSRVTTTSAAVPPRTLLEPVVTDAELLARATTWAIGVDPAFVYYGDAGDDVLRVVSKLGGPSVTVSGNAPWSIAVAPPSIVWIGAPGNIVLRTKIPPGPTPGPVEVLRRNGVFSAVAADGRDVYVAEVRGADGRLVRLSGDGGEHVTPVSGQPRAVALDAEHVYVQTDTEILRAPRGGAGGEGAPLSRVAVGVAVSRLVLDERFVYTTARVGPSRALARVPKSGGKLEVIEHGVRDAPIAVFGPEVFFLDADQPNLRRVTKFGGASAITARAPALARVTAMTVDESGIFLGTDGEGGGVLAMPLIAY